jgi:uncharacterized protein YjiS (DUF1127 family)
MTIQFFAPRHGRAPGQIEPAAQACSGSSSAYGRGSESSTMNSLRASVSRPRTSSFCATELPALLRKPAPGGATMFERDNSLPPSLFLQAERQARLDSLVIKACMRGTMSRLAEWLSALGTWGTRLARNLADGWLLRCAIRELHQLDDRTLADIGITRGEIESALRNGLPTRVTHNLRQHAASSSAG